MRPAKHISKDERTSKILKKKEQKFDKKVTFYSKVKDCVRSLHAKDITKKKHRRLRTKLRAYDLSALSEFLPDFKSSKPLTEASLTFRSKNKQKLVEKESMHLKAVLGHQAFQTDPLSTIHQHILNTQPPLSADEPKPKQDVTRRKSRRKGAKVVSSDVQSMDTV